MRVCINKLTPELFLKLYSSVGWEALENVIIPILSD